MVRPAIPLQLLAVNTALLSSAVPSIADVQFKGAESIPVVRLQAAATAARASETGDPRRRMAEAVEALYRKEGYSLAKVLSIDEVDGRWTLVVAEGRIRKLVVTGTKRTRAATIERAISLKKGSVWRETIAAADRDRLARLRIFDDVMVSAKVPDETEDAEVGAVDLVVKVKEAQTGNIAATVGYGDATGLLGFFSLSEDNLLGTGDKVRVDWQRWARIVIQDDGTYAQESARQAFQFGYGRPVTGTRQMGWDIAAYDQNTIFLPTFNNNMETVRNYERRRGGNARFGTLFSGGATLYTSVRSDRVGYDALPDRLGIPPSVIAAANTRVGSVGLQWEWDRRDKADFPRTGFRLQGGFEQAGRFLSGESVFQRYTVDLRRYQPFAFPKKPGASIATRFMAGTSRGDLPLSEQYFLGGFDLLRGYDLYSVRGDRMGMASAELRVPVGPGLVGVLFVDHGTAWLPGSRAWTSGWKTGYGAGLRFSSPIGPLRLDFAQGSRFQTYVSLGQAF